MANITADFDGLLRAVWETLKAHVPEDDPLKADVEEYLAAGEWGICCEAMAILSKRYDQYEAILPQLEPLMMHLILNDEDEETP
jgi:hypothetical protein